MSQISSLSILITPTTTTTTLTTKKCPECGHEQKVSTDAKRTTCSKCDKPIKLRAITAILATVLMIAIVPAAYAEITVTQENLTVEEQKVLDGIEQAKADGTYVQPPESKLTATIQLYSEDITIQAPFPVSEWYCGSTIFKFGIPEMTCVVVGSAPVGEVWNEQENKWIPESVIAQEAAEQEKTKAAISLTDEEKQLQAVQNLVDRLKQKSDPTAADKQILTHFDNLTLCMRGLEDTEAMQTPNTFVVPVESLQLVNGKWVLVIPELDDGKSLDFGRNTGIAGKLYMAAQECEAQIKLMGYVSPDHYRNKVMTKDDFQLSHQDAVKLDKGIEAFGTDFTNRNDGSLEEQADIAWNALCLSDKVTDKFRKQINCPDPYIGLYQKPVGQATGLTLETASPNIKHERYGTVCGLIPNDEIVNDIHWQYLEDLEQRFNCSHWDRINGIMLFDPQNYNQPMIDIQIAKYLESQK